MWKKSLSSTFSFYLLHFQFFAHHSLTSRNSSIIRITKAKAFIAHIYLQLAEELTQEYGIPEDVSAKVTAVFLKQFRKCPDNATCTLDAWRTILWSKALGDKYSRFARKVYERWLYLRYHYMVLTPATVSMLRQLRKKYLLGLITNGPSNAQWEKVRKLSLEQYFDIILVSGDLPWEKPDVEIFQKACDLLNVRPKECIMVGDKLETDILGGIEAGLCGTVWIPTADKPRLLGGDPKPNFTIRHVTELMRILDRGPKAPELEDCSSNASDGS
ncbi:N-acylneuraminate-9-phosphatase isoform X1 [Harpegnathos saltator]|uniref:N-acylneuraminate-9-phosphatase isoform X1 n=1 Tax=Harpegnathos saltator TaxID=610380 RepID=UPI0005913F05|nr:N-acylneuraminate-9-phosphatase isoform X1 [Harpegnathos saltator]